jgi:uncharacterized protein (TIGR03435 family)
MFRCTLVLLALPLLDAQFAIQPNHSEKQTFHLKDATLDAEAQTLEQLLQFAYHMQSGCTLGPGWISEATYDVHGSASDGRQVRPQLQQALTEQFKLVLRKETRPMDVYVLAGTPVPAAGPEGEALSHIRGKNLSTESIARYLASWLGKPVVDETGLHDRYTVDIAWDANDSVNLIPAVERIGLKLRKDRRPVEVLVVEKAQKLE